MNYNAILTGTINGGPILVKGSGTIIEGLTEGNYTLLHMPPAFNPLILKGALVTGYPNACKSVDESVNVFDGHSYTYERKLVFNNGGLLEMTAKCDLNGDTLESLFEIKGSLQCGEIMQAEPIIETWQPVTDNKLSGVFRIVWNMGEGQFLSADAFSSYSPKGNTQTQPVLHRYIEITADFDSQKLHLRQNSKLFHRLTNLQ